MKDLAYYLSLPYTMEIIPDTEEGGYGVRFPELPGCITCGDTLEEAVGNATDAKKAWLEAAIEEGTIIAEPGIVDLSPTQFKLRMPRSLYRDLAEHSKAEGVSMNQYCLYLLTKYDVEKSIAK